MTLACPACGRDTGPADRFCAACGAPLGREPGAGTERKRVSAVFVDLVDYTRLSEAQDPEDTRALLETYWHGARAELERYGGTVEKFIGDAVVAVFGAPVTHEDDAERAVRAALRIRDRSRDPARPDVRVAVATGLALVHLDARPEAGEALVVGDVVTTAARLQANAPRGGVLVDEATYAATEHVVAYRRTDPQHVKGRRQPVAAWRAVELRLPEAMRPSTRFVGRADELELLTAFVRRLHAGGGVELVTIVGEPGIGKSRLVRELALAGAELWEMRTPPYGEGSAFSPLADLLKEKAGVVAADDPAQASARVTQLLERIFDDDEERRRIGPHLRRLVGLEATPAGDDSSLESFAAWRRVLEAASAQRPVVLVLEDAHSADGALLDFVEHLVEWAGPTRILVVCTARPDLLRWRPGWSGGAANALTLSLPPLSDEETAALVADVLGREPLDAERRTLLARAGGNPLHAEQLARMLTERADPTMVPGTVQAVIAARIDRLPALAKEVLVDASVVGGSFSLVLLAAVTPRSEQDISEGLHVLERMELVGRRDATGNEWALRHRLVNEVAYARLTRPARVEKHRRLAERLERRGDDVGAVAHHYARAREEAAAAGAPDATLDERARTALSRAAERALDLGAYASAVRLYARALELWPTAAPARARALLSYGRALWNADGSGEAVALEARDLLVDAGDADGAAEAEALVSEMRWYRGDHAAATAHLGRAVELVAGRPPTPAKARVLSRLARSRMLAAAYEEAIAAGRDALDLAAELGLVELQAEALNTIGSARTRGGDLGGIADVERAVELAGRTRAAVVAYNNLAALAAEAGDVDRSREATARGAELAERLGDRVHLEWFDAEAVDRLIGDDRWDDALDAANRWLASTHRTSYGAIADFMARALILHARGSGAAALEDLERGLHSARAAGDPQTLVPTLAEAAFILLNEGQGAAGRAAVEEALDVCDRISDLPPLAAVQLAFAACDCGLRERLAALLARSPAWSRWTEAARHYVADELEEALELLSTEHGRWAASYVHLRIGERDGTVPEEALAFYREVGAERYVSRCEQLLTPTTV